MCGWGKDGGTVILHNGSLNMSSESAVAMPRNEASFLVIPLSDPAPGGGGRQCCMRLCCLSAVCLPSAVCLLCSLGLTAEGISGVPFMMMI